MRQHSFVDRFFHSSFELTDFRQASERDINSLFSFLNNLHSFQDRINKNFNQSISTHPEFKFLRLIRNYMHHVGDVDEERMYYASNAFYLSHTEMIIIPTSLVAKSIVSFRKNKAKNENYVEKEILTISKFIDVFAYIDINAEYLSKSPFLMHQGKKFYSGFDIFKCVYNITNIIADICRRTKELAENACIVSLDDSYTTSNNIEKYNLTCHAGSPPFLSTKGFIFPESEN